MYVTSVGFVVAATYELYCCRRCCECLLCIIQPPAVDVVVVIVVVSVAAVVVAAAVVAENNESSLIFQFLESRVYMVESLEPLVAGNKKHTATAAVCCLPV